MGLAFLKFFRPIKRREQKKTLIIFSLHQITWKTVWSVIKRYVSFMSWNVLECALFISVAIFHVSSDCSSVLESHNRPAEKLLLLFVDKHYNDKISFDVNGIMANEGKIEQNCQFSIGGKLNSQRKARAKCLTNSIKWNWQRVRGKMQQNGDSNEGKTRKKGGSEAFIQTRNLEMDFLLVSALRNVCCVNISAEFRSVM